MEIGYKGSQQANFDPMPTATSHIFKGLFVLFFVTGCFVLTLHAQTLTSGAASGGSAPVNSGGLTGSGLTTPASVLPAEPRVQVSLPGAASNNLSVASSTAVPSLPRVFAPTRPRTTYTRYPWKRNILTTIFWVGETPTPKNPTPNHKSSWDPEWMNNFGGFDDPDPAARAWDFRPRSFIPEQNPFYIALPFNDTELGTHKRESKLVIPWFEKEFEREGKSVLKGRWLAIRKGSKVCYAQWEDCGPFETDDWQYVFGESRPKTTGNGGAGLDVSPAVRDFLGLRSGERCDWRFVDIDEVPQGPWRKYGDNNPFVRMKQEAEEREIENIVKLREMRDAYIQNMSFPN